MKNLKYFPFERNRYFYGKLLSVDDFETEQRYMNDKRRLLNRFLYGSGVVCGMQVVEVDDVTISLEMGMALDFSGREIIVESPITKRLSAIEGFDKYCSEKSEHQYLYLCITYEETVKEVVHNITKLSDGQTEEYNKYAEGYRLYLTGEEPEEENAQTTILYEDTKTVFCNEWFRISQRVPRFIQNNTDFDVTVIIEKFGQASPIAFSYELNLSCIEQNGRNKTTVSFNENKFQPAQKYEEKIIFHAMAAEDGKGTMELISDSFTYQMDDVMKREKIKGRFSFDVTSDSVLESMTARFYDTAMEDIMRNTYEQSIYLARINVIRAGDTYVIDGIENMPYKQYVWNPVLSGTMEHLRLRQNLGNCLPTQEHRPKKDERTAKWRQLENNKFQSGSVIIDLGIGGTPGQRFYSEEIVHELGLGEVSISLGLAKGVNGNNQIIYGNQDVFDEISFPKVALAAKVNMEEGTFVVGMKCLENISVKRIKIHWMAVKDENAQLNQQSGKKRPLHLQLQPSILNSNMREQHYFKALIEGGAPERRIKWSVQAEGGSIDQNGCYTAPDKVGVFEVTAQSLDFENVKASAFVIVRDS